MSNSAKERVDLGIVITIIIMLLLLFQIMVNSQEVHERLEALEADRQEQIDQREYEDLIEIIIQELEARQ